MLRLRTRRSSALRPSTCSNQHTLLTTITQMRCDIGILTALLGITAQANLIQNGDFETPELHGQWAAFTIAPNGFEWEILPPSIDLVNTYWEAASGDQSLDLA